MADATPLTLADLDLMLEHARRALVTLLSPPVHDTDMMRAPGMAAALESLLRSRELLAPRVAASPTSVSTQPRLKQETLNTADSPAQPMRVTARDGMSEELGDVSGAAVWGASSSQESRPVQVQRASPSPAEDMRERCAKVADFMAERRRRSATAARRRGAEEEAKHWDAEADTAEGIAADIRAQPLPSPAPVPDEELVYWCRTSRDGLGPKRTPLHSLTGDERALVRRGLDGKLWMPLVERAGQNVEYTWDVKLHEETPAPADIRTRALHAPTAPTGSEPSDPEADVHPLLRLAGQRVTDFLLKRGMEDIAVGPIVMLIHSTPAERLAHLELWGQEHKGPGSKFAARYRFVLADPHRSFADNAWWHGARDALQAVDMDPGWEPGPFEQPTPTERLSRLEAVANAASGAAQRLESALAALDVVE